MINKNLFITNLSFTNYDETTHYTTFIPAKYVPLGEEYVFKSNKYIPINDEYVPLIAETIYTVGLFLLFVLASVR